MEDFTYNAQEHKGYFKGKQIPSITQLIAIKYPLDCDIPEDRLAKASERGRAIHNDIELFNKGVNEHCETKEGHSYELIIKKFGFTIYDTEKQVFIRKGDEIIAFGTLDIVLKDKDNNLSVDDIKTICQFDNEKVGLQCNMYALAYEQEYEVKIKNLNGIWVRNNEKEQICQLRPLKRLDNEIVFNEVVELVKEWNRRNVGLSQCELD